MNNKTDISLIIVNRNVGVLLSRCIDSIKAAGDISYEVIVVDNASSDGSQARLAQKYPEVKLIVNSQNLGFAAACNIGIKAATGKYPVLLNPDTLVEPGCLKKLFDFMEANPKAGIAGPKALNSDGSLQPTCRAIPGYLNIIFSRKSPITAIWPGNPGASRYMLQGLPEDKPSQVPALAGVCLILRREMLEQTGFLDERYFMYLEDIDICLTASQKGWSVFYIPQARIIHHWGKSSEQEKTMMDEEHRKSMYLFFEKHHRPNFLQKIYLKIALSVHKVWLFSLRSG
ncbi:glycosyltransferase family 2 protein [candidate division TA06 bacterium]|uniref:Glycosyltransferase family 2 protein n=1 Tax=candidate division TA06 bacterium TaxID=2250710 RepID=A0A933ML68_UNCT6|nr:glycosyltransferase family 2 protein [candidate division TA06 bacterium]